MFRNVIFCTLVAAASVNAADFATVKAADLKFVEEMRKSIMMFETCVKKTENKKQLQDCRKMYDMMVDNF